MTIIETTIQPPSMFPGAFRDRPDSRDFKYEDAVLGAPIIDWAKGYNVETEIFTRFGITLKVESQNGSSSCVGQAFSKYAEVLNIVETGKLTDLSAKSIYEQIYLPGGGAYIRDGAGLVVNNGVSEEVDVSSYDHGNPPKEAYMQLQTITPAIRDKMKVYSAKEYRSIGPNQPDLLAHAILNNWGGVGGAVGDNIGWSKYPVQAPVNPGGDWGHAFYFVGFGMDADGKYFDFINSWGNAWGKNGRGRMYFNQYDMLNNTFGIWTIIDKPNINLTNMKIIKASGPHIYLVKADNSKKIMLVDFPTLESLGQAFETVTDAELASYPDGGTLVWTERIIN